MVQDYKEHEAEKVVLPFLKSAMLNIAPKLIATQKVAANECANLV